MSINVWIGALVFCTVTIWGVAWRHLVRPMPVIRSATVRAESALTRRLTSLLYWPVTAARTKVWLVGDCCTVRVLYRCGGKPVDQEVSGGVGCMS